MTQSNGNKALLGLVAILVSLLLFTVGYIISQKSVYGDLGVVQAQVNTTILQVERNDIRITGVNENIVEIKKRLDNIDATMNDMYKTIVNIDKKANRN